MLTPEVIKDSFLERLEFDNTKFEEGAFDGLMKGLALNTNIVHFSFINTDLSKQNLDKFYNLAYSPSLKTLEITNSNLGYPGTSIIAKVIKSNKSITTLILDNNNIPSNGIIELAEGFDDN